MFLGIDRPEWIQLWSGTVGALVAAVIGGLVALFVVRMTSKRQSDSDEHQRDLLALADFVAAADAQLWFVASGLDIAADMGNPDGLFVKHRAALIRLKMSKGWARDLGTSLSLVPHEMRHLLFQVEATEEKGEVQLKARALDALNTLASMSAGILTSFPTASKEKRNIALKEISSFVSGSRLVRLDIDRELAERKPENDSVPNA